MKKWIAMAMLCCWTNHLLRRSLQRSHGFCHAWTATRGVSKRRDLLRNFRSPFLWKNRGVGGDARRHGCPRKCRSHNSHAISDHHATRLYHSKWTGHMAPFSEFATHVKVGKEEAPVTVESAIFDSMTALASSNSRLSEDGSSYEHCDDGFYNKHRVNSVLVVSDTTDETGIDETDSNGSSRKERILADQLKNHPPNKPMTPRRLLHLGCIWYLTAEDDRKNHQLQSEEAGRLENGGRANHHQQSDRRVKPSRLSLSDAAMKLQEGDYLRIHHNPRRFHGVYEVDWSFPGNEMDNHETTTRSSSNSRTESADSNTNNFDALPVVVRQQGPGYCIIDKPPIVPVHATVDNAVENVANQLYLALEEQQRNPQNTTSFGRDLKQRDDANATMIQSQHHDRPLIQGDSPYLAPVQRIDVNTSGLLVVATSPEFAAYFSQLLRRKTATILDHSNGTASSSTTTTRTNPTIEKGYKCLVCIQPDEGSGESVLQAWKRLAGLQRPKPPSLTSADSGAGGNARYNNTAIVRHFLKASDRAPKLFVDEIPKNDEKNASKWYECLMEITDVGEPVPLYASKGKDECSGLANGLWPKAGGTSTSRMPPTAKAVVEVQVSLITGRTHQIRGQLSKLGFPIVGDEHYGGAVPAPMPSGVEEEAKSSASEKAQLLALQCCHIGFRDADYESVWNKKKRREVLRGRPSRSGRWVRETLHGAWWTPFLKESRAKNGIRFSDIDFRDADEDVPLETKPDADKATIDIVPNSAASIDQDIRPDLLPPPVQLSPGRNKYVVAKLRDPSNKKLRWFVKSAPMPYHAEVAFDLVEWIAAVPGYEQTAVEVTGGGRIDFDHSSSTVSVYGFSYRYGKGDHARVANLIQTSDVGADLTVTYDLSDNLY